MATRSSSRRYVLVYGEVELGEVTHQDMTPEEQHVHDTLHYGTAAEVRALRCPKSGGPLRIELCETADGKSHFRIRGVKSDFFFIRALGRSPKPAWLEALGSDFVTQVSDA